MNKLIAFVAALLVAGCGGQPPAAPAAAPVPASDSAAAPGSAAGFASGPATAVAPAPAPDATLGRLAYVRAGRLYIFSFATLQEQPVTDAGNARDPAWDATGHWLAFLWRASDGAPSEVKVATAEGKVVAAFPTVVDPFRIAWSPVAPDLLAETQQGLWLLQPDGAAASIAIAGHGLAWAPDGKQIAYVTMEMKATPPPADTLWTAAPAGAGAPVKQVTEDGNGIWPAGWWPDGQGLVYWLAPSHSASLGADGVGLTLLPFATGEPKTITQTLADPDWMTWAPDGRRFAVVVGGGRTPFANKALALCSTADLACRNLPQPAGVVTVNPAWSPAGDRLAFVRGADLGGMAREADWAPTRSLWVSAPDGSGAREITAAGKGVLSPRWSRDGRRILFLRDGAICLIDPDGGAPVHVPGGPVYAPVAWYQP